MPDSKELRLARIIDMGGGPNVDVPTITVRELRLALQNVVDQDSVIIARVAGFGLGADTVYGIHCDAIEQDKFVILNLITINTKVEDLNWRHIENEQ